MNIKISCLCLDKRKEMWTVLKEQVERLLQIPMETFIVGDGSYPDLKYDHIDEKEIKHNMIYWGANHLSHYNAFLSHRKIAQRAIDEDVDALLILEDDSYIIEDRCKLLNSLRLEKFFAYENWDVLYLGWWLKKTGLVSEDREDLEERWKSTGAFDIEPVPHPPEMQHEICGLHGILINKHFLKWIAEAPVGPIDSLLNHNFDKINAYFFWPKIVQSHTTWSYCENAVTTRNKL
jgi:GR25 family glycosyltransferase involved in LPS biosynthesis